MGERVFPNTGKWVAEGSVAEPSEFIGRAKFWKTNPQRTHFLLMLLPAKGESSYYPLCPIINLFVFLLAG